MLGLGWSNRPVTVGNYRSWWATSFKFPKLLSVQMIALALLRMQFIASSARHRCDAESRLSRSIGLRIHQRSLARSRALNGQASPCERPHPAAEPRERRTGSILSETDKAAAPTRLSRTNAKTYRALKHLKSPARFSKLTRMRVILTRDHRLAWEHAHPLLRGELVSCDKPRQDCIGQVSVLFYRSGLERCWLAYESPPAA